MTSAGFLSCALLAAAITADAQFQVVGPAPVSPAVARQQIKALLERVDPGNRPRTLQTLSSLTTWYRDILDQELIAAWRKDSRANLTLVLEPLADPRVATDVIEFSWREQRPAIFTPDYAPMLGRLMERYPDSAKPFLEDLIGSLAPGRQALDLSPPEIEAVLRILIDLPDIRTWKRNALQVMMHYPKEAKALLDKDVQGDEPEKRDRASRWLHDLAGPDQAASPQRSPAGPPDNRTGNGISRPTLLSKVEPRYCEAARKLHVQGSVGLQVVVAADGTPHNVKVIKPMGYGCDEAAIESVQQWRFNPGTKDGKAIAVAATVQVNFRLLQISKAVWAAGPMVFAPVAGITPPVVEDGTLPKPGKEASDESVVLEFTVGASGSVSDIHPVHGSDAAAELLTASLATWAFRPAMGVNGPVEAIGRVRFLKGDGDEAAKLPLAPPLPGQPSAAAPAKSSASGVALDGVDYSVAAGATDPKLLHKVDADYSDAGRAAGVKGVVVLRVVVDPQGNVVNPTVVTSLGYGLDEKAIEAVRQWKFTPGFLDGKPVAVAKTVEISFVLQ